MTRRKPVGVQQDVITGESIPTPEVDVSTRDVEYVEVTATTEKFVFKTRNTAIQDVEAKARSNFVAKRIKPKKDAEISKGDYDRAISLVVKAMAQTFP
jgi:hypothetical protein